MVPFAKIYESKTDFEAAEKPNKQDEQPKQQEQSDEAPGITASELSEINEENCNKTCQGSNKKCKTNNSVSWVCIELSDGEYVDKDTCTKACSDSQCEYKRITGKAKIPYHAFVCKSQEQVAEQSESTSELKSEFESDAQKIIDAYNKRKKELKSK